jgi:DNA-binding GntR family transcriptional regulator
MSTRSARKSRDLPNFIRNNGTPRGGLTKADAAYAEIRESILSCKLTPGSVIDQEMVADWLGSSTTPVREALRRLEAEQLVVMRAHSEARVAPASVQEFREFHLVRIGLEPVAAEVATKMASDELIESLRPLVTPSGKKSDAEATDLGRSRTFHQELYAASGNYTVTKILDSIWDRAGRYRVLLAGVGSVSSCESPEHQAIFAALEARDRKSIGRLVRADLESSYRRLLPSLEAALEGINS